MNREDKNQVIADLKGKLEENPHFYLTDISEMTVEDSNKLRGAFHEQGIRIEVVKNTLLKKAMESAEADYSPLYDVLKGNTSIMFTEVGNVPAKVIEKFRKSNEKPILKGAYVEESVYIGDDQVKVLSSIKSKDELIGDIIGLLQSPAKNVISGLKGSGSKLSGILKTLSEKAN
ncbi:MAG: 50S ribosomal protein L10 [Flavobacteriales bacterium]|nr:50S ribosomal protein L10 [Flavobacteriales bacterium]MBO72630.1 50S ribosomal protein L10 [Flavobacteriales bacterium]|tara:strand:- start:432 stop:953 length:522 start_codon:yes stop_codon:yes gene_type:complete